jgi:mitochondrial cardiolipin hydrolase
MTPQELEAALLQTLDDQQLSRTERKGLREVMRGASAQDLVAHRALAFRLARARLGDDKRVRQVIAWLEDVVKVLDAPTETYEAGVYFSPGDAPLAKIENLFDRAERSVDVCVFTITDDRIAERILAAHGRGVIIRIIADDDKAFDRGSDIDRIAAFGVPLRLDRSEHHMHHKFAVFDGRMVLTGSYNWTRSAARFNHENVVVTADPRLVRAFSETFEELWRSFE